jgi:hypothetical protein
MTQASLSQFDVSSTLPPAGALSDSHAALDVMRAYVAGQTALGYATFDPGPHPDDVILASFPKSGSTWMSYLLHQLRSGGDDSFRDIKDEVIDITPGHWDPAENPFLIQQRFLPRTFKTHGRHHGCPKGAKLIYVTRNPEDTLWSLYHFIHDLFDIDTLVPVEDFYRHYFVERFGTGHDISNIWDHLLSWYPHRNDPNLLWLHSADLLDDLPACLRVICEFIGIAPESETIGRVLDHAGMGHMRQLSTQLNPSQDNRTGRVTLGFGPLMQRYARNLRFGKLREGVHGSGTRSLPVSVRQRLDQEWLSRITPVLGFRSYAEMRDATSLLKSIGTADRGA